MKNASRLALTVLFCGTLAGCSTSNLETVKGGIMDAYPSVEIGKAFDASPLCTNPSWTEFETEQGEEVVQFECAMSLQTAVANIDPSVVGLYRYAKCGEDSSCREQFGVSVNQLGQSGAKVVVQFAMQKNNSDLFDLRGADIVGLEGISCLKGPNEAVRPTVVPQLFGAGEFFSSAGVLEFCLHSLGNQG